MTKIIEMYGTRSDGVNINFQKEDIEKIRLEEFVSVTVKEVMTEKEALDRYGYPHPKNPEELTNN